MRCDFVTANIFQFVHSILFHFHNCHTNSTQTIQDTLYPWHASNDMLLFVYALCVRCINIYCTNNKVINSTAIHIITMTIRHSPCLQDARPRTILLVYNVSKCVDILFGAFGNNSLRSSKDWRAFIRKNRWVQIQIFDEKLFSKVSFSTSRNGIQWPCLSHWYILTHKCGFHIL